MQKVKETFGIFSYDIYKKPESGKTEWLIITIILPAPLSRIIFYSYSPVFLFIFFYRKRRNN